MRIKSAADEESEFMQRLQDDGTPPKQDNNPDRPDYHQSTSNPRTDRKFDSDYDGGHAYRDSIPQQVKAGERIKEIASNTQDSLSTVATWTMFLTIAIIIFVMPVLIRILAMALRLILQIGVLIVGIVRAAAAAEYALEGAAAA